MGRAGLKEIESRLIHCEACPRLVAWRESFAEDPAYWARPVPGFGDPKARLLVLGLAPGAHGANRTGRPFTGDAAGIFLYKALATIGLSSAEASHSRTDGLRLTDVWITNALHCVPPANKPRAEEVRSCAPWLREEVRLLANVRVVLALGRIAHDTWLRHEKARSGDIRLRDHPFGHGRTHQPEGDGPLLVDSFHCSRYNVNTGRLNWPMFLDVMREAARLAGLGDAPRTRP